MDDDRERPQGHPIAGRVDQLLYATAGRAVFTIRNARTDGRYTYRVSLALHQRGPVRRYNVAVLTGGPVEPYAYLGTLLVLASGVVYHHGRTSAIGPDSPGAVAFAWSWARIAGHVGHGLPECVEFWHEGRCGRCGRPLTDPESIARGIGPVCVGLD